MDKYAIMVKVIEVIRDDIHGWLHNMEIGLALSGGGVRAAIFHLGVLRRLADDGAIEEICQLSTVSGGSLAIATVLATADLRWPTSEEFISSIYPRTRELLTTTDLFSIKAIGLGGILKFNVRLLFGRARLLATLLEQKWHIKGLLSELPERPTWWINATCLETGKNWRFSKREMGDWKFGRHYAPPFRIAEAAAASAAVPYAVGSLKFKLPEKGWYRTDPSTRAPLEPTAPSQTVHLWDGGAYENLGLESLFKPSRGLIDCDLLICSDASGRLPLMGANKASDILKGRLAAPRLFDICSDQIRALRSRMLISSINTKAIKGVLIKMGNSARSIDIKTGRSRDPAEYEHYLTDEEAALAFEHPTDLKAVSRQTFDQVARHGYETADLTLTNYASDKFEKQYKWL